MAQEEDEAKKFFDKMGEAAKQLADALIQMIKHYAEQQDKIKADQQKLQADQLKSVNKMLKDAGYETSPENAKALQGHLDKLDTINEKQAKIEQQVKKLGGQKTLNDDELADMQKLQGQHAALEIDKQNLFKPENLPDLKVDKMRLALQQKASGPKLDDAVKVDDIAKVEEAPKVGPELPDLSKIGVDLPKVEVPKVGIPELPKIPGEEVLGEVEDLTEGLDIEGEGLDIDGGGPEIDTPKIDVPKLDTPKIEVPSLDGGGGMAPSIGGAGALMNGVKELSKGVEKISQGMDINTMTRQNRSNSVGATLKSQGVETAKIGGPGQRLSMNLGGGKG